MGFRLIDTFLRGLYGGPYVVMDSPHHLWRSRNPVSLQDGEKLILFSCEVLAKLNKTVTPAKARGQNVLKRLDSCFRRNDGEGLLQEAL